MEGYDIKQVWAEYDKKLEKSLTLNHKIIREIQNQKVEAKINSFRRNQVIGVVLGIVWILFLIFLVYNTLDNLYFTISVGLIILFNTFAIAAYIRHLFLIRRINVTDSIAETQQKLAKVYISLNNTGRILILQTPLYCTFWYSDDLVQHAGLLFWFIQLVIVSFFTIGSVYLFRKLTYKNISIKWIKAVIDAEIFGGKKLRKAMEFLDEMEEF